MVWFERNVIIKKTKTSSLQLNSKRKFLLENQTQLKDLPLVFILALIDDENVILSGKFFGRVKLCKQVEANIKGSLLNFTSINFPVPKVGQTRVPLLWKQETPVAFLPLLSAKTQVDSLLLLFPLHWVTVGNWAK